MGSRKCVVLDCTSTPAGTPTISFHKFPSRKEFRENWLKAMKSDINPALQPSSSHLICSKHFKRADFQDGKQPGTKKMILKQGVVPSVFPWTDDWTDRAPTNKLEGTGGNVSQCESQASSSSVPSTPKSARSTRSNREKKTQEADIEKQVEEKLEAIKAECAAQEGALPVDEPETVKLEDAAVVKEETVTTEAVAPKVEEAVPVPAAKKSSSSSKRSKKSKSRHTFRISFSKGSKQKKSSKKKLQTRPNRQKVPVKPPITPLMSPKKQSASSIVFAPGTKLEAKDFNGKWHEAKIVEVDSDEREVLIHFEKNDKLSDEWIPMDSVRLRPVQVIKKSDLFVIGEKCMARWNDSRKFPATVQRIIEDGKNFTFYTHSRWV